MLPLLTAVLLLAANDPVAELTACRAQARAGDPASAAQRIAALCAAFPTWGLAEIELAETLMQAGEVESPSLRTALTLAVRLEPENPRAWQLAGRWHELRGEPGEALEAWQRVAQLRPDDGEAQERMGVLLVQTGRHAEAVPLLEDLLARRPQLDSARANLAEAYEAVGDRARAEQQLALLVRENPKSAVFRRRLAQFYDRGGQREKAEAVIRGTGRPAKTMRPLPASKR